MTDTLKQWHADFVQWFRDMELPMSDRAGLLFDRLDALEKAPSKQVDYQEVMTALALVPHALSHPDKCRWIAERLNKE